MCGCSILEGIVCGYHQREREQREREQRAELVARECGCPVWEEVPAGASHTVREQRAEQVQTNGLLEKRLRDALALAVVGAGVSILRRVMRQPAPVRVYRAPLYGPGVYPWAWECRECGAASAGYLEHPRALWWALAHYTAWHSEPTC